MGVQEVDLVRDRTVQLPVSWLRFLFDAAVEADVAGLLGRCVGREGKDCPTCDRFVEIQIRLLRAEREAQ